MVEVSVIMTSYNRDKYLSQAIKSVLNQSFTDIELVIVEDGSKDRSEEIIRKYSQKDRRIHPIYHTKNEGIAKSINDGIRNAKGKYIALIDSDDIWKTIKLEKQLQILKSNMDLVVWTNGEIIDQDGKYKGLTFIERSKSIRRKKSGDIFLELIKGNFINKSSLIFQKKNLGNIIFNKLLKRLDDYQFVVDLANKYKYAFIKEPLTKIRIHATQSLSNIHQFDILFDYIRLYFYFLRKYPDQIPLEIKLLIYKKIINISINLSLGLDIIDKKSNNPKVDPFNFIHNIGYKIRIDNKTHKKLFNWMKWCIYKNLSILLSNSFKKFILGISIIIKYKKLSGSLNFWSNFAIFYLKQHFITLLHRFI